MIVSHIEIVSLIVILLFGIPLFFAANKIGFRNLVNYNSIISVFNRALIIQVVIGLIFAALSWSVSNFDSEFIEVIVETFYTYSVIGIFMYMPILVLLNLLKVIFRF